MEASDAILREGGHRLTPQRHLILRVIEEAQEHLNIEQITRLIQPPSPLASFVQQSFPNSPANDSKLDSNKSVHSLINLYFS